jgi:hypothetical protein
MTRFAGQVAGVRAGLGATADAAGQSDVDGSVRAELDALGRVDDRGDRALSGPR